MQTVAQTVPTTLAMVRRSALLALDQAIHDVAKGREVSSQLDEVRRLIDALPLATAAHGLACNRLTNARRYLSRKEQGAARYELNLVVRSLRSI